MDTSMLSVEQQVFLDLLEQRANQYFDYDLTIQILGPVAQYLQDSEQQLINVMSVPQVPPISGGNIEFGLALYAINEYLPSWISSMFPAPQITTAILQGWSQRIQQHGPVIMTDGSVVGYGLWEVLDRGWLFPFVLNLLHISTFKKVDLQVPVQPFGSNPYSANISQDSLKIALMGDWGTGSWDDNGTNGPAAQIMQQIEAIAPDIVIHLGDVYYGGTSINLPLGVNAFMLVIQAILNRATDWNPVTYDIAEETDNLVNAIWSPGTDQCFTLNSNHEMYPGGNGYFPAVNASPFAQQSGTSYFMLTFQDWAILGLDSAYYAPDFLYMDGRLQSGTDGSQVAWIQQLVSSGGLDNKKLIVLTHHNALTYDGFPVPGYVPLGSEQPEPNLYQDVSAALGRDPDYWYWGHIHNGIVYTGSVSLSPDKQTTTLCRCLGHGAQPFGAAYHWLENNGAEQQYPLDQTPTGPNPSIAYYAHTPLQTNPPLAWVNRVKNGFTVLTLTAGSITEDVYEQGPPGTPPVWTLSS